MSEAQHLFMLATECSNPRANIGKLTDEELRSLAGHARWIQKQNDSAGGIPSMIEGLCDLEAARRFYQKTQDAMTQDTGRVIL